MKKRNRLLSVLTISFLLAGCSSNPKISDYYVNGHGHLIEVYENGNETDLGVWDQTLIDFMNDVTVSKDGYYVIKGIVTDIVAKVPESYALDEKGHLIVTYKDKTTEDLGPMDNSLVNGVTSITVGEDGHYVVNGIKTTIVALATYTVSFDTGFSASVKPQKIKDGYKVTRPDINRKGYTLNDWYCNGEEWRFNSDIVKNDMVLKAEWTANTYTLTFENDRGIAPDPMTVTYDSELKLPEVEPLRGYAFCGWYNGETEFTSKTWSIDSDLKLTAKWAPLEYKLTLDPGPGNVSTNVVAVHYGEDYVLPVPTNQFGAFTGWLCDGVAVTDNLGKSLKPWDYISDKTLTVDWTIEIKTAEELMGLANRHSPADYELLSDIDLTGLKWKPIGTPQYPFLGRLKGNGHIIKGMTITSYSEYCGLFGVLSGTVESIILEDVSVDVPRGVGNLFAGGLCGAARNATVKNVTVSGSITTREVSSDFVGYTGGIAGLSEGSTFANLQNESNVNAAGDVGGIVGYNEGSTPRLSVNTGDVISSQKAAGGIIGVAKPQKDEDIVLSETKNEGNIVSNSYYAGGIIGYYPVTTSNAVGVQFERCGNSGSVTGAKDYSAGGLISESWGIAATDCYNAGDIQDSNYVGGLFGRTLMSTDVKRCYSSGNLTSESATGGICGMATNSAEIGETVVFGSISGKGSTSTIAFRLVGADQKPLTNVYYNATLDSCTSLQGIQTLERYSADFYINTLFWDEYSPEFKTGTWVFSDSNYPTLGWEQWL